MPEKRGADGEHTRREDADQPQGTYSVRDIPDPPVRATAAQLARRKVKPVKGRLGQPVAQTTERLAYLDPTDSNNSALAQANLQKFTGHAVPLSVFTQSTPGQSATDTVRSVTMPVQNPALAQSDAPNLFSFTSAPSKAPGTFGTSGRRIPAPAQPNNSGSVFANPSFQPPTASTFNFAPAPSTNPFANVGASANNSSTAGGFTGSIFSFGQAQAPPASTSATEQPVAAPQSQGSSFGFMPSQPEPASTQSTGQFSFGQQPAQTQQNSFGVASSPAETMPATEQVSTAPQQASSGFNFGQPQFQNPFAGGQSTASQQHPFSGPEPQQQQSSGAEQQQSQNAGFQPQQSFGAFVPQEQFSGAEQGLSQNTSFAPQQSFGAFAQHNNSGSQNYGVQTQQAENSPSPGAQAANELSPEAQQEFLNRQEEAFRMGHSMGQTDAMESIRYAAADYEARLQEKLREDAAQFQAHVEEQARRVQSQAQEERAQAHRTSLDAQNVSLLAQQQIEDSQRVVDEANRRIEECRRKEEESSRMRADAQREKEEALRALEEAKRFQEMVSARPPMVSQETQTEPSFFTQSSLGSATMTSRDIQTEPASTQTEPASTQTEIASHQISLPFTVQQILRCPTARVPTSWAAETPSLPQPLRDVVPQYSQHTDFEKSVIDQAVLLVLLNEGYRKKMKEVSSTLNWTNLSKWHYEQSSMVVANIKELRRRREESLGLDRKRKDTETPGDGHLDTPTTKKPRDENWESRQALGTSTPQTALGSANSFTPVSSPPKDASRTSNLFGDVLNKPTANAPSPSTNPFGGVSMPPKTSGPSSGFSFGSVRGTNNATSTAPKTPFSASTATSGTSAQTSTTPSFAFGAQASAQKSTTPSVPFGASTSAQTSTSTSAPTSTAPSFAFGGATSAQTSTSTSAPTSTAPSFTFGGATPAQKSVTSPFSFGASAPAPGSSTNPFGKTPASSVSKPPSFGAASVGSSSMLSSFAQKAKTAEELAAERKAKAKDEDYDSDEETEEQWSARYDKEEAARKEKEAKAAQSAQGFTSSVFTPAGSATPVTKSPFTLGKPISGPTSLFNSRIGSPALSASGGASVFDTPSAAPSPGSNIFGHLSSGPSSHNQNASDKDDSDQSESDEEEHTEAQVPQDVSVKRKLAETQLPTDDKDGAEQNTKRNKEEEKPSLLSRISYGDTSENDGVAASSANGAVETPQSKFKFFDFSNAGAQTAPSKSNAFAGDQTFKPGTPIKFGTGTTKAESTTKPIFNFQPPTPSAPETQTKNSPFSFLSNSAGSSSKPSWLAPNVGASVSGSGPSSVFSSRAATPLSDAGTNDKDSTAENDNDDGGKLAQLDLSGLTDEELKEHTVLFHAEQAIAKHQVSTGKEKDWKNLARGPIWILQNKETGKALVRVRLSSGATPVNYHILPKLDATVAGSKKTMVLATRPIDGGKLSSVYFVFKTAEQAGEFASVYNSNKPQV